MTSPFASLDTRLRRLPDPVLLAIGVALVAGIAALGLKWAGGVPVVDFFLIPVAAVGWLAHSRRYGYVAALVASAASVIMALGRSPSAPAGAALTAAAARLLLYVIILSLLGAMRRMQLEHERQARTDPLTAAANSRELHALAEREIERSRRYHHDVSLAYLDIDGFKAINDRCGHVEGDHVLVQVSHVLRTVVRSVDTVARLGGDEFAVLMPETRSAEARIVVERVRADLARLATVDGRPIPCSIGLVAFVRPPESPQELVDAGDDLMYRAKRNGKDRVEQAERAGSSSP